MISTVPRTILSSRTRPCPARTTGSEFTEYMERDGLTDPDEYIIYVMNNDTTSLPGDTGEVPYGGHQIHPSEAVDQSSPDR